MYDPVTSVIPASPSDPYGAETFAHEPVRSRLGLVLAALALVALVAVAIGLAVGANDRSGARSTDDIYGMPLAGYDLGAAVPGTGKSPAGAGAAAASSTDQPSLSTPANPVSSNPPTTAPPTTAPPTTAPPTTAPPTTQPQPKQPLITNLTAPAQVNCSDPMNQTPYITIAWQTKNTDKIVLSIDGPGPYQTYAGGNGSASVSFACKGPHTYMITASGPNGPAAVATVVVTAKP